MSFTLAHLSDLHLPDMPLVWPWQLFNKRILGFQSWHLNRRRQHRMEVLTAGLERLAALKPDHIALTGDIVNIALPAEFERSVPLLQEFAQIAPISVIPGNHDAYIAGVEAHWALWRRWLGPTDQQDLFPYVKELGPVRLIGLSSAIPAGWGKAWGAVGRAQLDRLAALLAMPFAGWSVLLVHHPVFDGASKPRKALLDRHDLQALLSERPVDLILSGHEHKDQVGELPTKADPVLALTVPSASLLHDEPVRMGGFNLVRFPAPGDRPGVKAVELEHWRYQLAAGSVECRTRYRMELTSPGWQQHPLDVGTV